MDKIIKRLAKIEQELELVRGKEYSLPFGSSKRAKVSRKWDELAKEKFHLSQRLMDEQRKNVIHCEYYQHNECDCITKCFSKPC